MSTQKSNNFLRFLRQNLVLIIIIACVLAITGIIPVSYTHLTLPTIA